MSRIQEGVRAPGCSPGRVRDLGRGLSQDDQNKFFSLVDSEKKERVVADDSRTRFGVGV